MTAAGIRYVELARALQCSHEVTIAAPPGSRPVAGIAELRLYDPRRPATLRELFSGTDAVFAQPMAPRMLEGVTRGGREWLVDLMNPQPFEGLEFHRRRPRLERKALEILRIDRLTWAAHAGTAFACGSERQRDMWLGYLAACRRLDTDLHAVDATLRRLIDVVPSGIPSQSPEAPSRPVLRGPVFPEDARILLWNGGLWDWLDPITVVEALRELRRTDERWVLAFGGAGSPVAKTETTADRVRRVVRNLDLDAAVHLPEGWTPYDDRAGLLLESDIGVSTHLRTLEARFSYRNRLLDFIWAGLPIICTKGDDLGDTVEPAGWGVSVEPSDPQALAHAAIAVADRGRAAYARAFETSARELTWSRAADRLLRLLEPGPRAARPRLGVARRALSVRHTAASMLRPD